MPMSPDLRAAIEPHVFRPRDGHPIPRLDPPVDAWLAIGDGEVVALTLDGKCRVWRVGTPSRPSGVTLDELERALDFD